MAAAIIERGDNQLRDGFSGGRYTDAQWVIDLLAKAAGYEVAVGEDGDVTLLPTGRELSTRRDGTPVYDPDDVIGPDHYRVGKIDGTWYHSDAELNRVGTEQHKIGVRQ